MDAPLEPTPQPGAPEPPADATPPSGGLSRRSRAWIGMGAVLGALVLLTMLPSTPDPNAPPPAADAAAGAAEESSGGLAAGDAAPLDFTLKDINGVDVALSSFKGKVILLNFWATWCGPCRLEIPDLMELQNDHRDDLVVLGIDVLDDFSRVRAFADELKVNYPLLDANNREDVEKAFGPMWGLPTTVIVDRDGKIFRKHSGIATKEQFAQYVESLL